MSLPPAALRLFNTFILLTFLWHIIACCYWALSVSSGLGSTDWTPTADAASNSDILNYFLSMCWTVQTTFSASPPGAPQTLSEAVFTVVIFLSGIAMNAGVIGSASTALQNLDEEKTRRQQLIDRIIGYMKKRELPAYFQRIILDYYRYMSQKHSEEGILDDL